MNFKLQFLAFNGTFLIALCAATYGEIVWLQYVVIAFVWFMVAVYTATLSIDEYRKRFAKKQDPSPLFLGAAIDAAAMVLMLNAGWYVTAAVYAASAAIGVAVYGKHRLFRWSVDR